MNRRTLLLLLAATSLGAAGAAQADSYPSHPIKIIVPFSAGGPLDFVARAVGEKLSVSLKQTVVVENRPGAAGNIGTEAVAKAAPDGYTLLVDLCTTLTVNPALYKHLPFDPNKDFRPISLLTDSSQMLVVHPSVPVNSLAEFVSYARKKPVVYAHAGYGSPGHLAMEYFRMRAHFQAVAVPFKGNAPLVTALLGGHVQAGFVSTVGVLPHVLAGKLKGLAISSPRRSPLAPKVPTVAESGYPGFRVDTYFVMMAPAGVPDNVATLLESKVRDALKAPDLQAKLRAQDLEPVGTGAAAAKAEIDRETKLWGGVVKAAHMHVE
ncbi:MAG TPA: tripartite tricarboxylate transporter substrate binding protein [Pseudolabrys sp.]|jgi:tripartite-type tricarboxylate transporter receptor subunit TctC|nr:tripartite tricarboxylate transporter substrate binding protein [Pseudolabrys sp.]